MSEWTVSKSICYEEKLYIYSLLSFLPKLISEHIYYIIYILCSSNFNSYLVKGVWWDATFFLFYFASFWVQLFIHYVIFMCLCNSVMLLSGHMTPILLILLCCSPEGFFACFPLWKFVKIFLGSFFLIGCEVKGQGCRMCTDCKARWGTFIICEIGLYKMNWIELNVSNIQSLLLR